MLDIDVDARNGGKAVGQVSKPALVCRSIRGHDGILQHRDRQDSQDDRRVTWHARADA